MASRSPTRSPARSPGRSPARQAAPSAVHPATVRLMEREQVRQRSPEWFAVRRGLLTASDAASALNVKPYPSYRGSSRAELLRRKVADAPLDNMFVAHGQLHEDAARDWAAAALGETVLDVGLVRHPSLPWLAASPDGVTLTGRLLEIKCPLKRRIQPGTVPGHYWPQVQVQMECCDVDQTLFVQYKPAHLTDDGRAFIDIVVVERDREWFGRHVGDLEAFWREYMAAAAAADADGTSAAPPAPTGCDIRDDMYDDFRDCDSDGTPPASPPASPSASQPASQPASPSASQPDPSSLDPSSPAPSSPV